MWTIQWSQTEQQSGCLNAVPQSGRKQRGLHGLAPFQTHTLRTTKQEQSKKRVGDTSSGAEEQP